MEEFEVVETRKLASIRKVDAVQAIDGADAIELAVVGGWKVVIKKGEFQPGDLAVYFEIDSFLPDGELAWQFLIDKSSRKFNHVNGHRLRTIKLRGQISQGLILPIGLLADRLKDIDVYTLKEGDNITEALGIVKWDPPLSAELQGFAKGLFPSFIPKTDQERAQNIGPEIFQFNDVEVPFDIGVIPPEDLDEMIKKGIIKKDLMTGSWIKVLPARGQRDRRYEVTLKMDGSSMTVFARKQSDDIQVGVCSRNLELKISEENATNSFVAMAINSGLLKVLENLAGEGRSYAVQGELMGPGIQGNREQFKDFKFFMFEAHDLNEGNPLLPADRAALFVELVKRGAKIEHVKTFANNVSLADLGISKMDELLTQAESPSLVHQIAEGKVYKDMKSNFSFKTISNLFLAKEKD